MDSKRNTIQRQLIFDAVRELNMHATAEQVYEYVIKKYPSISKATVYRNLSQMSDAGELQNIGSLFGSVHYDHICHKHYHFICEECKQVFDINECFPDICSQITGIYGFVVKGYNLNINGLCRDCSVKQDS